MSLPGTYSMKAYLIITGTLFALLALAHLLRTIVECRAWLLTPGSFYRAPGSASLLQPFAFGRGACFAFLSARDKKKIIT